MILISWTFLASFPSDLSETGFSFTSVYFRFRGQLPKFLSPLLPSSFCLLFGLFLGGSLLLLQQRLASSLDPFFACPSAKLPLSLGMSGRATGMYGCLVSQSCHHPALADVSVTSLLDKPVLRCTKHSE